MIMKPAIRSLVSANGPSVTGGLPSPSERTQAPSDPQGLAVDVLSAVFQAVREVLHVLHVRLDLGGGPLVHRHVVDGRRCASVMLEKQVLGHEFLPSSQVATLVGRSLLGRSRGGILDILR